VAQLRAAIDGERAAAARNAAEARDWIAKLEGDVRALQEDVAREVRERRRLGEENARLAANSAAFERLPRLLRRLLLKKIRGERS
jgi:hypothetical protein